MKSVMTLGAFVFLALADVSGCSREQAPRPPRTSQPEIPADASIRLINDPMPAQPPVVTDAAPVAPH